MADEHIPTPPAEEITRGRQGILWPQLFVTQEVTNHDVCRTVAHSPADLDNRASDGYQTRLMPPQFPHIPDYLKNRPGMQVTGNCGSKILAMVSSSG